MRHHYGWTAGAMLTPKYWATSVAGSGTAVFWCLFTSSSRVLFKQMFPIILCLAFTILLYMSPHSALSTLQQAKHFCTFNSLLFNLWQRTKTAYLYYRKRTGDIRGISSILGPWKNRGIVRRIVHLILGSMFLLKLDLFDKFVCLWGEGFSGFNTCPIAFLKTASASIWDPCSA